MAERRMFTQKITESDAFLDMPPSTQALYFHLCMNADDDGFVKNPKRISRMIGASEDDLKVLLIKRFALAFESGVIVIKHWRMHNLLRKDRYSPTEYTEEMNLLSVKENGAYTLSGNQLATNCQPDGNQLATQYRLGKDSIGKDSIGNTIVRFTPPSVEEVDEYCRERCNGINGQEFCDFYESKGWMVGRNKMKDWKACVRTWERSRKYRKAEDNHEAYMERWKNL